MFPRRAITMGVGTILSARRICMMAFGEGKAPIVAKAVEGPITASVAASFLQQHSNSTVFLDEAAAAQLTRMKSPWLHGPVKWNDEYVRKAVIWLARLVKKPILKLTDEDYNEHGLQDLLAALGGGSAYDINLDVFRALTSTITGWPGGKPPERKRPGDLPRPSDEVFPKRVLIFSPHPDDDVISMGGTLIRLVDQGHEVHVAYPDQRQHRRVRCRRHSLRRFRPRSSADCSTRVKLRVKLRARLAVKRGVNRATAHTLDRCSAR